MAPNTRLANTMYQVRRIYSKPTSTTVWYGVLRTEYRSTPEYWYIWVHTVHNTVGYSVPVQLQHRTVVVNRFSFAKTIIDDWFGYMLISVQVYDTRLNSTPKHRMAKPLARPNRKNGEDMAKTCVEVSTNPTSWQTNPQTSRKLPHKTILETGLPRSRFFGQAQVVGSTSHKSESKIF